MLLTFSDIGMPPNHQELGFCISRVSLINSVNKSWPHRGWVSQGSITNHNVVNSISHLLLDYPNNNFMIW